MTWTNEELKIAVSESTSMRGVLEKLKFPILGCYYTFFKKKIELLNIDRSHWVKQLKISEKKKTVEDLLATGISQRNIKNRLIKEGYLKYNCSLCNINEWRNKKLVLQLDHIDGVNTNNQLNNLRLLCPNCHSQTDTFTGKNVKRNKIQKICNCGVSIRQESTSCVVCTNRAKAVKTKIEWPTNEKLLDELETLSFSALARKLGVSDNAIRKRLKTHK